MYPSVETEISLSIKADEFIAVYPQFNAGKSTWKVTARPDGSLLDEKGKVYPYLFWEAPCTHLVDSIKAKTNERDEGTVVARDDVASFLNSSLEKIGLNDFERCDFITYWLPKLISTPFVLVRFHFEEYEKAFPMEVSPTPDTLIRVMMSYKKLDEAPPIDSIRQQKIPHFDRKGFTIVEWGGIQHSF